MFTCFSVENRLFFVQDVILCRLWLPLAFHLILVATKLARRLGCCALESAAAQVSRAGVRVDSRHGPLKTARHETFGGGCCDCTIEPRSPCCLIFEGMVLVDRGARQWMGLFGDGAREERRHSELSRQCGGPRPVVFACEVGGRWSKEARDFLRHLARKPKFAKNLTKSRGCVAVAVARRHGLQFAQSVCGIFTDVRFHSILKF